MSIYLGIYFAFVTKLLHWGPDPLGGAVSDQCSGPGQEGKKGIRTPWPSSVTPYRELKQTLFVV